MSMKAAVFFGCLMSSGIALCAAAKADTIGITYYTIGETDKDANHLAGGVFNNEVQASLGPDGLPVLNTPAYGCLSSCYSPSGAPTDVLANGEITYWSPLLNNGGPGGSSDVTLTGTGSLALPVCLTVCSGTSPSNFFPPNGAGGSDSNGFQAAVLNATLDLTTMEQLSFSIGADDMAFAYLDGQVVCDLGGVHASSAGSCITPTDYSPGDYSLEVFFVDINNVQSGLYFDVTSADVITTDPSDVPEPASLTLFGAGLFGLGSLVVLRRRKVKTA